MKIKITEVCSVCGGDGLSPNRIMKDDNIKCHACKGTGRIEKIIDILAFKVMENKPKQVPVDYDYKTDHSDLPLFF